ncbi:hypothetical protein P8605_12900 [Streptomyces sp. T-3]|nr:hypothetical protein [Streptomyces sp. T-3]
MSTGPKSATESGLPELFCPFPLEEHPDSTEIEEHVLAWVQEKGLCTSKEQITNSRRATWGRLVSRMYPRGSTERVKTVAEFMAWYGQYDEAGFEQPTADGHPELSARNMLACQRILDDPTIPLPSGADPYHLAWQDLWLRMRTFASPTQLERLAAAVSRQFVGNACEALYSHAAIHPSVADYLEIRRLTSCAGTGFSIWCELVGGYEVPAPVWFTPPVQEVARLVNDIYGSVNDIFGAWRDLRLDRGIPPTLVSALAQEHQLPLAQALGEAARIHREQTEAFIQLAAQLREQADPVLGRYLDELEPYIAGHHHWYLDLAARYHHTNTFHSPAPAT